MVASPDRATTVARCVESSNGRKERCFESWCFGVSGTYHWVANGLGSPGKDLLSC
jgi:hypothetical protein